MKKKAGYKKEDDDSDDKSEVKSKLDKEGESVTIRKIENGYIATSSYYEGTGNKREWKSKETYYEKNPL